MTEHATKPKRRRKWIIIALAALIFLWIIGTAIGTDETSTEADAEPEPTQTEQVETAEPETEPEPEKPESSETKEPEPEATTPPQGIDAQIAVLTQQDGFNEAEVFYSEGDDSYPNTSVNIYMTIEPGWSESTMCRDARQHTINGLKFLRDNVDEPYDEAQFSFTADGEPDATGNSATLPMAHLVYEHDTVQAINDDTVTPDNVWDAADGGGKGIVCKRAED